MVYCKAILSLLAHVITNGFSNLIIAFLEFLKFKPKIAIMRLFRFNL